MTLTDLIARVESADASMELELLKEAWQLLRGEWPDAGDWCLSHDTKKFARQLVAGARSDPALMLLEVKDRWPQIEYMGPNPKIHKRGHRVTLWYSNSKKFAGHSQVSFALALLAARLKQEMNDAG